MYMMIIVVGILLCIILYRRYFPVLGVPCENNRSNRMNALVLDIRDYNIDVHNKLSDMRIPYAYLKRYSNEIPKQTLHVIANDQLELNLGLRFLRSRGYQVESYQIGNCPCKEKE